MMSTLTPTDTVFTETEEGTLIEQVEEIYDERFKITGFDDIVPPPSGEMRVNTNGAVLIGLKEFIDLLTDDSLRVNALEGMRIIQQKESIRRGK